MFLENYKLQTVLLIYGIDQEVPQRALEDAKLIQKFIGQLNGFEDALIKKVILSIMVDRFSSRIYNPKLLPVKINSIVVS